jgi:membrane associated rhomboid family serine protease
MVAKALRPFPVAITSYLVVTWALFLVTGGARGPHAEALAPFTFSIPELSAHPVRALGTLITAPFLNHSWDQHIYATVLLLVFGVRVEQRFGWRRTCLAFFVASAAAGAGAGTLLHLIYPEVVSGGAFADAWGRTYSGASAGAFGLLGVLAASSRRRYLLLAAFAVWELGVWYFYLFNYTPAFHLTALVTGYALGRLFVRGGRPRPDGDGDGDGDG